MQVDQTPSPRQHWLVVNTLPHKEAYVVQQLSQQGYSAYCPLIAKRIRHARRVHDAKRALFPSYVFVERPDAIWRPIMSTFGVRRLLMRGAVFDVLDGAFIDGLKRREIDGVVRSPAACLSVGQIVRVADGPFDGLIGEIVGLRGSDRVSVLLSLLNNQIKTHLPVENLHAI